MIVNPEGIAVEGSFADAPMKHKLIELGWIFSGVFYTIGLIWMMEYLCRMFVKHQQSQYERIEDTL